MELWSERVSSSPANTNAIEPKRLIATVETSNITNDLQDYLDRAEAVVDAALSRINNADPRLINVAALAGLGSALANVVSYFNSWKQGSGDSYLTANAQAELG